MSVISIMESVINIALIQWVVIDVIVVWDIASMMTDTIALVNQTPSICHLHTYI
jgi:hypothetical protein